MWQPYSMSTADREDRVHLSVHCPTINRCWPAPRLIVRTAIEMPAEYTVFLQWQTISIGRWSSHKVFNHPSCFWYIHGYAVKAAAPPNHCQQGLPLTSCRWYLLPSSKMILTPQSCGVKGKITSTWKIVRLTVYWRIVLHPRTNRSPECLTRASRYKYTEWPLGIIKALTEISVPN